MKPYQANLINAVILTTLGLWGYFASSAGTALIPVGFGVLFALMTPPFKKENKVVAHIVVLLTFLLIIALIKPLMGAIGDDRTTAVIRVSLMIASCIYAMTVFIRSFIDARKARLEGEA